MYTYGMTRKILIAIFEFLVALFALGGISQGYVGGQWEEFCYFTFQSNLAIAIVFIWEGIATLTEGYRPWPWLKGIVTLCIIITGVVANTILPAPDYATEWKAFGFIPNTALVHITVPIMATLDFFLFERHKRYKWWFPLTWPLYAYCWFAFILIRAAIWPNAGVDPGSHNPYPYWFVDVPKIGWGEMGKMIIYFTIGFLILGYILYGLDKALPRYSAISTIPKEERRRLNAERKAERAPRA